VKESEIMAEIMVEVGAIEGVMMWRNNTGMIKSADGRFVRFGQPGSPDLIAIANGKFVGLEVKTPKGRVSPVQRKWRAACEAAGGRYAVVRSAHDAWAAIMDALHEDDLKDEPFAREDDRRD